MALPERLTRGRAQEAVAAFRPGVYADPHKFNFFSQELANMSMASSLNPSYHGYPQYPPAGPLVQPSQKPHHQSREWMQPLKMNMGLNGFGGLNVGSSHSGFDGASNTLNSLSVGQTVMNGIRDVDVSFGSLALTRQSKALKLISPETNAPIKPDKDSSDKDRSDKDKKMRKMENNTPSRETLDNDKSCDPIEGSSGKPVVLSKTCSTVSHKISKMNTSGTDDSEFNGPISPTSGLPIGSKLRRWMGRDSLSPRFSPRVESSVSGSMDLCLEQLDRTVGQKGLNGHTYSDRDFESIGLKGDFGLFSEENVAVAIDNHKCNDDDGEDFESLDADQSTNAVYRSQADEVDRVDPRGLVEDDCIGRSKGKGIPVPIVSTVVDPMTVALDDVGSESSACCVPKNSRLRMWMSGSC